MQRSSDLIDGPLEPRDQFELDFSVETHTFQDESGGEVGYPHTRGRKRCRTDAGTTTEEEPAPRARERQEWPARTSGVVEGSKIIWEPVTVELLSRFLVDKWLRPVTLRTPTDLVQLVQQFDQYQAFISAVRYAVKRMAPETGQVLTREEAAILSNAIADNLQLHDDVFWRDGEYMKCLYNCETMEDYEEAFWKTQLILPLGAAAKYYSCFVSVESASGSLAASHYASVWDSMGKLPRFIFDPIFNLILACADWESCVKAFTIMFPTYRLRVKDWWKPVIQGITPEEVQTMMASMDFEPKLRRTVDASQPPLSEVMQSPIAAVQSPLLKDLQASVAAVPLNAPACQQQVVVRRRRRMLRKAKSNQQPKMTS